MDRSTILFLIGAVVAFPAWTMEIGAWPRDLLAAWLSGLVTIGLAGGYYWMKERRQAKGGRGSALDMPV